MSPRSTSRLPPYFFSLSEVCTSRWREDRARRSRRSKRRRRSKNVIPPSTRYRRRGQVPGVERKNVVSDRFLDVTFVVRSARDAVNGYLFLVFLAFVRSRESFRRTISVHRSVGDLEQIPPGTESLIPAARGWTEKLRVVGVQAGTHPWQPTCYERVRKKRFAN